MRYLSTRGAAPMVDFRAATLGGLAPDGGLYMPEAWPGIEPDTLAGLAAASYEDVAHAVLAPFTAGVFEGKELADIIAAAYASFDKDPKGEIIPLRPLGAPSDQLYMMELFHGPTLAFKDVAMQFIGTLFDRLVSPQAPVTVLGATSGDTGAAAVHAFAGKSGTRIVMLHPQGRISEAQRRQMTTHLDDNVFNIAVKGTFDDCQAMVKAVMSDAHMSRDFALTTVNSINWARIAAQSVYYAYWSLKLSRGSGLPGDGKVDFVVPSGNFGNAFSAYVARRMGFPVGRVTVATNSNDVLVGAFTDGCYAPGRAQPTISPAMDISTASNFERLLFELCGRDSAILTNYMSALERQGRYQLGREGLTELQAGFSAVRVDETQTREMIRTAQKDWGVVVDPHTAVGLHAARALRQSDREARPLVCLSTAHPAKFLETVEDVLHRQQPLPKVLENVMKRPERLASLPADAGALVAYIKEQLST